MATKNARKYCNYNALCLALRKKGFDSWGTLATLLLDTFIENEGRLLSNRVVSLELCPEGLFREWRKDLVEKGWLIWSEAQTDKGQYYPGKKLIIYINKEKIASKEMATKDEVPSKAEFNTLKEELGHTKMELTDTKNRVTTIEDSMKSVYSKLKLGEPDPPHYSKLKDKVVPKDETN